MREKNYLIDITAKGSMTVKEFEDFLDKVGDDLFEDLKKVTDPRCDVMVTTMTIENQTRGGLGVLTSLSKDDLENSIYSHLNVNMFDVEVMRV